MGSYFMFSKNIFYLFCIFFTVKTSAQQRDTGLLVSPAKFIELSANTDTSFIFDVRTREEYNKTHIRNAVLIDSVLPEKVLTQAKSGKAVVLLYSIANGRSVQLAKKLRKEGYAGIYALDGGIASWISGGQPFYSQGKAANVAAFKKSLLTDSLVIVDVASAYCPPCIKVARIIDSFAGQHPGYKIIKLDIDRDALLIAQLKIAAALPAVVLYKSGNEVWRNSRSEDWSLLPQTFLKYHDKK
jgi:rhodanese-related sulfurtransferase